jgi:hypothetical protein
MVLVDFAQTCPFVRFRYIISKIIISLGGDPHILRNRLPENCSIWHQKGVDSTYNLSNDLFLVKQLHMGTYVFKICKILEISS